MATRVAIKAYLSPTLVLLAFDWADGADRNDFLGFAIERKPGFGGAPSSFLPNRLGFDGPATKADAPSDTAPIQKFMWWDSRIDDVDREGRFSYNVSPVVGAPGDLRLLSSASRTLTVRLPAAVEQGIGSWFNRAVVSSQAFTREFGRRVSKAELPKALGWLANGMQGVVPDFLAASTTIDGAIYHLTDEQWIIPALAGFTGVAALVANDTKKDHTNADAIEKLTKVTFSLRTKANIMHDKLLVRSVDDRPAAVLMGSANFTTEGIATQANVLHTFDSPELATLYLERQRLLVDDPTVGQTAAHAGWSDPVTVGDASVRVFFSPEPKDRRDSLDPVVEAVKAATSSVFFCLFKPTDKDLLEAVLGVGDDRLMLGLVNSLDHSDPSGEPGEEATSAKVTIFHRDRRRPEIVDHSIFARGSQPTNFWWEASTLSGMGGKFPVYIHHKFVIIDADTDHPVVFTGSANMSNNSLHRNDENLLMITGSPRLAAIYLAEGMRLYEHYRARAAWNDRQQGKAHPSTFQLAPDASWSKAAYREGTSQFRSRVHLAGTA
jgi:hypothetical protein